MNQFQRIGLVGTLDLPEVKESLRKLESFLLSHRRDVVYEKNTAAIIDWSVDTVLSSKDFPGSIDLGIVVGGDGSMLSACRNMASIGVPLLGINRGRLGFLTDISPDEIEARVLPVIQGDFKQTQRFMLECNVSRNGEIIGREIAVNEVALHPGKSARMMTFELYVDSEFVYSQRSDGLIVATPTGSTAYSLSAGGPIMHPKLDAVVLVPMFPHPLSSRPIVVDGKSEIKLVIGETNETYPQVSFDGQMNIACAPGDIIRITKKPFKIRLIHPTDHNFYATCRDKLGWASEIAAS
mgnify:CR=1 FL=1